MCSSVVLRKMPENLKDQRIFTLLIQIGQEKVIQALSDLGARVNLMPHSVVNTLGLWKPSPRFVVLQISNRTKVVPKVIIEDILIKFGMLIIPTDFIVFD